MLIGGTICRYLFTSSKLPINMPRSAFEQHSMSLGRCLSHKFNLRFLLSIERGLEPCLVSCYFFWLVILTSSKVHLHYKFAILTRPSSPAHLFIRVILKSCLLFALPPRRGWPWPFEINSSLDESSTRNLIPFLVEEMSCGQ